MPCLCYRRVLRFIYGPTWQDRHRLVVFPAVVQSYFPVRLPLNAGPQDHALPLIQAYQLPPEGQVGLK